jgi:hypothetical protein
MGREGRKLEKTNKRNHKKGITPLWITIATNNISACYSWEMASNVDLCALLYNKWDLK